MIKIREIIASSIITKSNLPDTARGSTKKYKGEDDGL